LVRAVGEQNADVQVVVPAAEVVIQSVEGKYDFLYLVSRRASDSRLGMYVQRWIASRELVKASRRDWHIDALSQRECLKLRHLPVVFGLDSFHRRGFGRENEKRAGIGLK